MHDKKFKFRTVSLCFLVGISLASCRDFSNVRDLGNQANDIQERSTEMANDFYDSCMRRARIPRSQFPDITNTRQIEEQKCENTARPASNTITDANKVLIEYLIKLAKLAGDGSSVVSSNNRAELETSLGNLTTALGDAGVTVPEPVSTIAGQGAGILNVIFDAIASEIRQDTLAPVMVCTDDEIQNYTQGLEQLATIVYINQLEIEAQQHSTYFTNLTPRLAGVDFPPSEALSSFQLDHAYNAAIDAINAKKDFANEFARFLGTTRGTHSELSLVFAESLDLTQKNAKGQPEINAAKRDEFCTRYEAQIHREPVSIQLTPSQAGRITTILKEYETTTAPILEKMKQVDFDK